jgi:hypothetical protein
MSGIMQQAGLVDVDPAVHDDLAYAKDDASFTISWRSSAFDYSMSWGDGTIHIVKGGIFPQMMSKNMIG